MNTYLWFFTAYLIVFTFFAIYVFYNIGMLAEQVEKINAEQRLHELKYDVAYTSGKVSGLRDAASIINKDY